MHWSEVFNQSLTYDEFLNRHASPEQRSRWGAIHDRVVLSDDQRRLLGGFTRLMPTICLAGAWCGDCVNQCPILDHLARASGGTIALRLLDRDAIPEVADALSINGGRRVPVVLILSEDHFEVSRMGDRTLSAYRRKAAEHLGASCPTGLVPPDEEAMRTVTQEWLDQFERAHLLLRLSARLREKHGD